MSKEKEVNQNAPQEEKKGVKGFFAKHSELLKFILFNIAGALSSAVELVIHFVLEKWVFASLMGVAIGGIFAKLGYGDKGSMLSYLISTTIGYAIAFVLNRKVSFKADSNVALSVFLYILMVIFTIFMNSFVIGQLLDQWITVPLTNKGMENLGILVSKMIAMAVPVIWTYPCNRFIIHRKKKETDAE